MKQEEYSSAIDRALDVLIQDVLGSQVEPLAMIRMMVKETSRAPKDAVMMAMYGLFLAGFEVTDGNIRWLLRDAELGFDSENTLFTKTIRKDVFPLMDDFKAKIESIKHSYQ